MSVDSLRYGDLDFPSLAWEAEPVTLFWSEWSDFNLSPPPSNSSKETLAELDHIEHLLRTVWGEREEEIRQQDALEVQPLHWAVPGTIETEFLVLLGTRYVSIADEVREDIARIASQLTTIGLRYKRQYDRPRPYQLFNALGRNVVVPASETAHSASYPSTHALIGNFLGWYLGKLYPRHASALAALGKRLGDNRVVAGWHFPSDVEAGQKLAVYLRQWLKKQPV